VTRRLLVAASLAIALAGCGSSLPGASIPRSRTFIDAVPALPADLDSSATPSPEATALLPSWSSDLVAPAAARPGPAATIPDPAAVAPYLATAWTAGPHGDITFTLRRGVRGASGNRFSAADVAWSIRRDLAVSPVAPFLFSLANLDRADPVTILGPYSVRVNATAPSPFLLAILASPYAPIDDERLLAAHARRGDPWAEHWAATNSASFGAYYVAEFKPNERIILLANPHAFDHPFYRRVEIKQMPDAYHRLQQLQSGALDHSSDLDWRDYTDALLYGSHSAVDPGILETGPTVETWFLDVHDGPLRKPGVREAISLAIDRADLSGRLYAGYAAPDVLAIPPLDGQSQPPGYDLALARRLLAAAGYPHGLTLAVYVSAQLDEGNEAEEVTLLAQQLKQAGITLEPSIYYDEDQLLALERAHAVPSAIEDITPAIGGAAFSLIEDFDAQLDSASPAAAFGYTDPALDRVLARLRDTPPGAAASALSATAARLAGRDWFAVNLLELPTQTITRARIAGYAAYSDPVTYYEYLHPAR
jgi:peptide/nickel transport system substrate-binding protein